MPAPASSRLRAAHGGRARRAARATGSAAAVIATAVAAGCGEGLRPSNVLPKATDTLVVYAINGTPKDLPSAIALAVPSGPDRYVPVAVDLSASEIDVAFDVDQEGRAVLYPPKLVNLISTRVVGFQRSSDSFDALGSAPRGTYHGDTTLTVADGETVSIQAAVSLCASASTSAYVFAKLVVDSVSADARALHVRVTVNPNCGNRSL